MKKLPYGCVHYPIAVKLFRKYNKKKNPKIIEFGADNKILPCLIPEVEYISSDKKGNYDLEINLNSLKELRKIDTNSFDGLFCLETLEHIAQPDKVVREFKRIVKPNGIIIISMPNEYNIWMRINYLIGRKPHNAGFCLLEKGTHVHLPRIKDIEEFLSKHFNLLELKFLWTTKSSRKGNWYKYLNYFIDKLLTKFYPNLFARIVVTANENKMC